MTQGGTNLIKSFTGDTILLYFHYCINKNKFNDYFSQVNFYCSTILMNSNVEFFQKIPKSEY